MNDRDEEFPQIATTTRFRDALTRIERLGIPCDQEPTVDDGFLSGEKIEKQVCETREAIMDEILAEHPNLTRKKLSDQMEKMGF